MTKNKYVLILLSLIVFSLQGQQNYLEQIVIKNKSIQKQDDLLRITMNFDLSLMEVNNQHMVILTPVLQLRGNESPIELPPVIINGKTRHKMYIRSSRWHDVQDFPKEPQAVVLRHNGVTQTVDYETTVPFDKKIKKARLVLKEEVKGCADCNVGRNELLLSEQLLPDDFVPTYKLVYIVPEMEEVKNRGEQHSASLNYPVGRSELLPSFGDNAAKLAQINEIIWNIKRDENLKITGLTITGYASPEGNAESNYILSLNRAKSFAAYLERVHGSAINQYQIAAKGEDWEGLRKAVESSQLFDKAAILSIIDTEPDLDIRDAKLQKLSGGQTYRILLNIYYPPLRRNDYSISYISKPFNVSETQHILRTRPQLLSLHEMFLLAQTYPAGSKEFNEVFDIAVRLFPDDPIAIINYAAAEIENGNMQEALERLKKIEDDPRAWNNMGVAYARMGENEKAMEYFSKAADQGDTDAKANKDQLQCYFDEQN